MLDFDYQGFLTALIVFGAVFFIVKRWAKKTDERKGPDVPVDQLLRKHSNKHKRD